MVPTLQIARICANNETYKIDSTIPLVIIKLCLNGIPTNAYTGVCADVIDGVPCGVVDVRAPFPSAPERRDSDDHLRRAGDHHAGEMGEGAGGHRVHAALQHHQRHPAGQGAGGEADRPLAYTYTYRRTCMYTYVRVGGECVYACRHTHARMHARIFKCAHINT